jgi:carboxyl-terminal processing protease
MLANGFTERIFAANSEVDVFTSVEPIAEVLDEILQNYVDEPALDNVVEGALIGMMNSLDDHSSFIPAETYSALREDTQGEFEGIGVSIKLDDDKNIVVFQPIAGSPAARAGVHAGDYIIKIGEESTQGMSLSDAADRIRGPRGTDVTLTLYRVFEEEGEEPEELTLTITRGRVPLESLSESRIFEGGIGYVRVSDFKKTTADELKNRLREMSQEGMKALVLDLRWNPGGLLTSSKEVSELFLAPGLLITYTRGRQDGLVHPTDDIRLTTENRPVLPLDMPIVVLVNETTASSSEIVTGALQFHQRAIIVGETTFGKGSVQTIIPLRRPQGAALRLTTALYYTPAEVTIHKAGIHPDIEVISSKKDEIALLQQMYKTFEDDPEARNNQNHGVDPALATEETVVDTQLARALELLRQEPALDRLITTYHKDVKETQVAAAAPGVHPPEEAIIVKDETGSPAGPDGPTVTPSEAPASN